MIVGIGADIVQITRIDKIYKRFGDKFLEKNYHISEIEEFRKIIPFKRKISFLAKRFAAKEAVAKALGKGIGVLNFKEISIDNDKAGKPRINIFNEAQNYSSYVFHISLADDYPFAIAYVIAQRPAGLNNDRGAE